MTKFQGWQQVPAEDFVRPEGRRLFWFLLREHAWAMMGVNCLTVLMCLPVVTAPAAIAACTEYCLHLIEDRPGRAWGIYWMAFRKHGWSAAIYGLFCLLLPGGLFLLCNIYLHNSLHVLHWQSSACLAGVLLIWMVGFYAFPMLCRVQLPVRTVLSNSFRLFCLKIWKCILPLMLQSALLVLSVLCLPVGLLFPLLLGIVFPTYLSVCLCYPDILKYVVKPFSAK